MDDNQPQSRVVVISGGSKGLGRAFADHFLRRGDYVATFARSATPYIDDLTRTFPESRFFWRAVDISDAAAVTQFVRTIVERQQRIDVLINNVAIASDGLLATMRDSDIDRLVGVNLTATLHLTKACVRFMIRRAGGSIINISSILGHKGFAGVSVYSATKAALDGLTRSLAREVGPSGIRVNSIAPGFMETELSEALTPLQRRQIKNGTPLGRLGTVDDVLGAVEFFASPASTFVTGQLLTIDGGFTC